MKLFGTSLAVRNHLVQKSTSSTSASLRPRRSSCKESCSMHHSSSIILVQQKYLHRYSSSNDSMNQKLASAIDTAPSVKATFVSLSPTQGNNLESKSTSRRYHHRNTTSLQRRFLSVSNSLQRHQPPICPSMHASTFNTNQTIINDMNDSMQRKRHKASTFSSTISSSFSSTSTIKRPFQILGLQQVAVGSTDLESLRTFWMDIIGLTKINTHTSEKENVMEDILIIGGGANAISSSYSLEKAGKSSSTSDHAGSKKNKSGAEKEIYIPPVELDLMCPIDEHRSPKVHKPPLNHIGLWIDDLPTAVEWMKSKGVRFTPGGIRKGAAGYDVTFIHPKGNEESPIGGCGVLIELVQAPTSVIKALKK